MPLAYLEHGTRRPRDSYTILEFFDFDDGVEKILAGSTTVDEVSRVTVRAAI